MLNSLADKVKAIFSRKQASDDARLADVHEAVTTVTELVQTNLSATDQRVTELETELAQLKQDVTSKAEESAQAFNDLKAPSITPKASASRAASFQKAVPATNC